MSASGGIATCVLAGCRTALSAIMPAQRRLSRSLQAGLASARVKQLLPGHLA